MKVLSAVFGLAYLPLNFYAQYLMLRHVGATELMWFLFCISLPAVFVFQILAHIAKAKEGK